MISHLHRAALAILCVASALPAGAGPLQDAFGRALEKNLEGALAVIGISAVPSETASTLFLDTSSGDSDNAYDFQASQLGGGFRVADGFPIWLEGYIGWSRYDPVLVFSDGAETGETPLKWTNVAATGGIGVDIDLDAHWTLRPQFHLTVGRVQTDLSVGTQAILKKLGIENVDVLSDGGVWVGGVGGSLALAYNRRWENDWEADLSLRYTHIHLEPIAGDKELVGAAEAIAGTLWTRLRQPTGWEVFNRPVRIVYEASGSLLPGDQGEVLGTEWLAQIGFGGEIDLEETRVPWVTTTRLVARYTRGEALEGYSIGLAASF